MATLEDLVVDVVEDAVEWPANSFAVIASAPEPDWYVQFAIEDHGQLIVEVVDPRNFGGPTYSTNQLERIASLGFSESPENYGRQMRLDTPGETDEVCRTIRSVLTDVFGLSEYHDVTLKWHRDDEVGADDTSGGTRERLVDAAPSSSRGARERLVDFAPSLAALMRGEIGRGVRPSGDPFQARPLRTWFEGSCGEDPDVRAALAAALECPGAPADYLQVLGNAFMAFSEYRRVRVHLRWLADAEQVARQMLDLGELARSRGWKLGDHHAGSEVAMFYAREGLMTEARRARKLFGLDEYTRDDFDARVAAWEKSQ